MNRVSSIVLVCLLLFCVTPKVEAKLSREQAYSLFSQANQFFREANSTTHDPDQAERLYDQAILNYEKIINEGHIRNAKLYYNLGNAYFLKEDIGRAILNYRRAEELDKTDANIHKNLAFARSRRIDKVEVRTEERILQTLFFWHYDFSLRTKFLLTCFCFAILCVSLTIMAWYGKAAPWFVAATLCGLLTVCFLTSVVLESRVRSHQVCGVITAQDVVARQGDGPNYPESFKDPLHAGTEFDLLERRSGWFHIRLSDNSDGWIPDNSADLV